MKKYTYDGLGALDQKTMVIGGMVAALGLVGFLAYRAKKKADEDAAAATAAAAAGGSSSGTTADALRTVNPTVFTARASTDVAAGLNPNRDFMAGLGRAGRLDYRIY